MDHDNENRKGNTVLLTVIAVATLLVAVVGATFAYFSVQIGGNEDASSIIIKTAQLGIIFNDGNEILEPNIMPGWTADKEFTVQNNGEVTMTYKLVWANVTNEFAIPEDLVYEVTSTATGAGGTGPTGSPGTLGETVAPATATSTDFITGISIPAGATHSYTLTLTFINYESSAQNENQNKKFMGKIQVIADNVVAPEPEPEP